MIQVNFSTSSLTYSQIWLSPRLVDRSQPTYITNLKKNTGYKLFHHVMEVAIHLT
jgi:hypothetical protein